MGVLNVHYLFKKTFVFIEDNCTDIMFGWARYIFFFFFFCIIMAYKIPSLVGLSLGCLFVIICDVVCGYNIKFVRKKKKKTFLFKMVEKKIGRENVFFQF